MAPFYRTPGQSWEEVSRAGLASCVGRVCLAGVGVSNNWSIIDQLKKRLPVTVTESLVLLYADPILAGASVLLLDCGDEAAEALGALRFVKSRHPSLCVVLVGGALTPKQVAEAYREGARDYFPRHSNADLVVERVLHLCRQARVAQGAAPRATP